MGCGEGEFRKGDMIMSDKTRSRRDVFGFSLSGLKTMAAYTTASAIAQDQINKAWDEKLGRAQREQVSPGDPVGAVSGRFWLSRRHRSA